MEYEIEPGFHVGLYLDCNAGDKEEDCGFRDPKP